MLLQRNWRAVLLLGFLFSCAAPVPDAPPYGFAVGQVQTDDALPVARVREVVTRELAASSLFSSELAPALPVDVRVRAMEDGRGRTVLRLSLRMETPPARKPFLPDGLVATVQVEPAGAAVDPEADLPFAARRAAAVLEARVLLSGLRSHDVAAVLRSSDEEIVGLSLEFVRDYEVPGVESSLVQLLAHESDDIAGLALEALGALGDERHVEPILREARLSDRRHTFALYETLGRLGGPRAEAFLDFAVRNEDDPQLSVAAEQALSRARDPNRPARVAPPGGSGTIARGHR